MTTHAHRAHDRHEPEGDVVSNETDQHSPESAHTCRIEVVAGQAVRVRGAGEWDDKDREAFAQVVRAASDLLLFHTHNEWTGMCACGEGPFTRPEWAAHVSHRPGEPTTPDPRAVAREDGGDRG